MNNRKRNAIYSLVLLVSIITVWLIRNRNTEEPDKSAYLYLSGEAQGTTYNITYEDSLNRNFKISIDSLLTQFDNSLSTYKKGSEINQFNQTDSFVFDLPHFLPVLEGSKKVYEASNGAFDPTVYPLISAWGFGPEEQNFPDSTEIEAILKYVGFEKIKFNETRVMKNIDQVSLDFNAIAQGFSIDVLFNFLESKGIKNLMVELGGEVRVNGINDKGDLWSIGIDNPKPEDSGSDRIAIVQVDNQAISTSGNYRKYFEFNGVKYGHTINPKTGYPIQRDIISSTVIAPTCMEADAWSTAFMVTGLEEAKKILQEQPHLAALFIYETKSGELETYFTENLTSSIIM
jgi:thiamine biosynthesis lipoprotein